MRIRNFQVSGYRSLKDTTVTSMSPQNVFHGENDTGKSNLLRVLEMIFRRKTIESRVYVREERIRRGLPPISRVSPFWSGTSENLGGDFYMRQNNPIRFRILIEVSPQDIFSLDEQQILESIHEDGHDFRVQLKGQITKTGNDGDLSLSTVLFNNKPAMRKIRDSVEWLPDSPHDPGEKQHVVESVLDTFNDQVYVVPASRFLAEEIGSDSQVRLESTHFKNWLHNLSLSEEGYEQYRRIIELFAKPPLNIGEISFLKNNGNLDLMVDDGYYGRMRIDEKGTGIQQLLILIGYITETNASVLCVEEPELNLSFKNQDMFIDILRTQVRDSESSIEQTLITSHSDHVGSRDDFTLFHVEKENTTDTIVREFTIDDKRALFPRN